MNEPVKLGWIGGELYLEVNPDAGQSLELDETGKYPAAARARQPARAGHSRGGEDGRERASVDWSRAERAALRRSGVPTRITGGPPRARRSSGPVVVKRVAGAAGRGSVQRRPGGR